MRSTPPPSARVARLEMEQLQPPWRWRWRLRLLRFESRSFDAAVDPTRRDHQLLVDRPTGGAGQPRDELAAVLRDVLGAELAGMLAGERVDVLSVRGPRAAHVALALPFEALLGPACTVVREVVGPRVTETRGAARGLLAAFALCPSASYLPLHLEAADLQSRAHRAGHQLDELFVTFTASQLLRAGRDRALVHIAGHGRAGALLCMDDEHGERWLTSQDLIAAWRDAPPALVVLNTCEGSSDRDHAGMLGPFQLSSLDTRRRLVDLLDVRTSASSSMALDLAAALPTSVIAMRTPVQDASARAFASAFYAAYLEEAAPLVEAFAGALRASDAFDQSGLPIPMLFVGALPARPVAEPPHEDSALSDRTRRIAGYDFHASAPFAQALDRSWLAWLDGLDPMVRDELVALIRHQAARRGIAADQVEVFSGVLGQTLVIADREGDGPRAMTGFELDILRSGVVLAEVRAMGPRLRPQDVRLIASATCQVPHLLEGLRDVDLDVLAAELRRIAGDRTSIGARELQWELARSLLAHVPADVRATITEWAERRWAAVAAGGDIAADVAASHYLLGDHEYTVADTYRMLNALIAETGASADQLVAALTRLTEAGVVGLIATSPDEDPEILVIDRLTAARAWASCSAAAASAYLRAHVDQAFQVFALRAAAELADDELLELGRMCVAAQDARVWSLVGELRSRGGDARTEALACEAETSGLSAVEGSSLGTGIRLSDDPRELDEMRERLLADADGGPLDLQTRVNAAALDAVSDAVPAEGALARIAPLADEVQAALVAEELDRNQAVRLLDTLMAAETNAHDRGGDAAAALASSERHLRALQALGAPIQLVARESALAAERLLRQNRPDRARLVLDPALKRMPLAAPAPAFVLLQAAHVAALGIENRIGQVRHEADVLLGMLLAWERPQRMAVNRALFALAKARFVIERPGAAVGCLALADWTGRDGEAANVRFAAEILGLAGLRPADVRGAAVATGRELSGVLGRLGLARDQLQAHLDSWLAAVEGTRVDPLERAFGAENAAALRERASAGCRATQAVIAGFDDLRTERWALPDDWSPDELAPHNARYGPLSALVDRMLGQNIVAGLPVVARAYRGDREARVVWAAATAGDRGEDGPVNGLAALCMRLGRGDPWPDVAGDLARVAPGATAHAVALVEHCMVDVELDAAWEASMRDFETVSMAAWPYLIRNAGMADSEAALLLRLLEMAVDRPDNIVTACQGRLTAGEHAATLSRLLRANVDARARLATALAREGHDNAALEVLAPDALPAGPVVALKAAARRAELHHDAERLDEARTEVATSLAIANELEPTADALSALIAGSLLAARLGELQAMRALSLAVLQSPWPEHADPVRHLMSVVVPSASNVVAALVALEDPALPAQVRELGTRLGFGMACRAVSVNIDRLDADRTSQVVNVLLELDRAPHRDPLHNLLEPLTVGLLETIAGRVAWAGVEEALRRRIAATPAAP